MLKTGSFQRYDNSPTSLRLLTTPAPNPWTIGPHIHGTFTESSDPNPTYYGGTLGHHATAENVPGEPKCDAPNCLRTPTAFHGIRTLISVTVALAWLSQPRNGSKYSSTQLAKDQAIKQGHPCPWNIGTEFAGLVESTNTQFVTHVWISRQRLSPRRLHIDSTTDQGPALGTDATAIDGLEPRLAGTVMNDAGQGWTYESRQRHLGTISTTHSDSDIDTLRRFNPTRRYDTGDSTSPKHRTILFLFFCTTARRLLKGIGNQHPPLNDKAEMLQGSCLGEESLKRRYTGVGPSPSHPSVTCS